MHSTYLVSLKLPCGSLNLKARVEKNWLEMYDQGPRVPCRWVPLGGCFIRSRSPVPQPLGIIRSILSFPHHRMDIPFISGRRILGIPHSLATWVAHPRWLLLPSINTEETANFLADKEKEEQPPKVQLDDVLACFKFSLKSIAFFPLWFDIVFVIWFSQPCFLVIDFAIHAPSSDHLCLIILTSLLWLPFLSIKVISFVPFISPLIFTRFFPTTSRHYLYPFFNTICFYHGFNVPSLVLFWYYSNTDINILVVLFFFFFLLVFSFMTSCTFVVQTWASKCIHQVSLPLLSLMVC